MHNKKVAVIGAGPMGLAVAYQLLNDGYFPVVYDADNRVGGMTATFDFDGLEIERYYHFHCTSDLSFLCLLKELNIENKMNWVETKMGFYFNGKMNPWGNPIALLKFPDLSLVAKFRYGLHAFVSTKINNWIPLDSVSAVWWVRKWVGREAYDTLWKKLFEYKFYEYSSQLSAAWIWSRIRRIGRSRYSLFKEKLGYLEGGSNTFLEAMSEYIIKNGGRIQLCLPVKKIVFDTYAVKGVETSNGFESFDLVISTIPLPYISGIAQGLPQSILKQYDSIKNVAVVCVIAKLSKKLSENFWLNINDDRMDIPGMVEYSNLRPLDNSIVYIPFYMPFSNPKFSDSDDKFIKKVKVYMKLINSSLEEEDFLDIRVSRYRYAQPVCEPRFLDSLPDVKLPVKGLWIADTSYYYPEDRGISESVGFGRKLAKLAVQ